MARKPSVKAKSSAGVGAFRLALAGLSLSDQKSLFDRMAPAMRLALWQDRLKSAAAETSSRKQKAVLRELLSRLSEQMYSDSSRAARAGFTAYWEAVQGEAYAAFKPSPKRLDAIIGRLGDGRTAEPLQGAGKPACTCSTSRNGELRANDCGALSKACQTGACTPTNFGCGVAWLQSCDGLCTGKKKRATRTRGLATDTRSAR